MLFLSLLLHTVFPIVAAQTKSYVCVAGQCLQGVAGTNSLSPHPCRSIHVLTCLYSRCHPQHTIKPSCFTSPGRIHFINPASAIIYRAILPTRITVFSIRFLIIFILRICHHISAFECILTTRCSIISSTLIRWAGHLYSWTKSRKYLHSFWLLPCRSEHMGSHDHILKHPRYCLGLCS